MECKSVYLPQYDAWTQVEYIDSKGLILSHGLCDSDLCKLNFALTMAGEDEPLFDDLVEGFYQNV